VPGTLGQALIDGAQQLSDKVNDGSITAAEWLTYVNQGIKSLHSVVTTAFKDTFYQTYDFTVPAGTYTVDISALSPPFWRVRGLDFNPDTNAPQTVRRFNFGDRNTTGIGPFLNRSVTGVPRRYRVVSRAKLLLEPHQNAGGPYRLYYVPPAVLISNPAVDTLAVELDPWNEYVQVFAAIKALNKEETPDDPMWRRLNEIKAEIEADVETDEGGQDGVVDVEADGPGPYIPWGA
jgi:hypothetical protein